MQLPYAFSFVYIIQTHLKIECMKPICVFKKHINFTALFIADKKMNFLTNVTT